MFTALLLLKSLEWERVRKESERKRERRREIRLQRYLKQTALIILASKIAFSPTKTIETKNKNNRTTKI